MKIKIVVEDKKKGKIEIPLSKNILHAWYDFGFMVCPYCVDCFELNKIKKDFFKMHSISLFLVNDVIYNGKCWTYRTDKKGNLLKDKKGKLKKEKAKTHYLVKEPIWEKK